MPELPEVETTLRGIAPYLVGNQIIYTVIRHPTLRWPISEEIVSLKQQRVLGIERRAKYLLLQMEQGWIVVHLGMSGCLKIITKESAIGKHDHIDLVMADGVILRYTDPRRFGCWLWFDTLAECHLLSKLGPEPLSDALTASYLWNRVQKSKVAIKQWLMNNRIVVGVGNIYASEVLFQAKILPNRAINTVSQEEWQKVVEAIQDVLERSIAEGGTTLKDFLQSDGKPGYFVQKLHVYGRTGKPCYCCGHIVESQQIGQRNSYYCSVCQH